MIGLVDGNNFFVSCERVFNPRLRGRPVAVLSNNDGCCVARSNEFKALGIAMGTPYFQLKHREATGELIFCSSNYELYGDMSRRIISILREEALEVEQYSIDEAFIVPPKLVGQGNNETTYYEYGKRLRSKILRWVGIPCGVGFAPTKTLAKIANHIAKKYPDGVFVMPEDAASILDSLHVDEVWGVGKRLLLKLRAEQIFTARNLRDASNELLRSIGGVTLLRTSMELRGISCHEERGYDAEPDSVSCSRSFGTPATTLGELEESIASFTSQAAEKLRRHGLLASGCNIYAQLFNEGGGGECIGRTIVFSSPTDATNEIMKEFHSHISSLYIPGIRYRKTGIVFFGLERADAPKQLDLFASSNFDGASSSVDFYPPRGQSPLPISSKLYKAVDALNQRYGKGKVFSAAEGVGVRKWQMKRTKLSCRATTRWKEILKVH